MDRQTIRIAIDELDAARQIFAKYSPTLAYGMDSDRTLVNSDCLILADGGITLVYSDNVYDHWEYEIDGKPVKSLTERRDV
jgi:hypothetical protein